MTRTLMTAHYARLSDTTVRRHWEAARKVNAHGEDRHARPRRAARRGRLGQAAARPRHPGAAQRLLRAARCADLPARQRLPDLPDVRHHRRVPAAAPRAAPAVAADHLRGRSPRPDRHGRDEPAGRRQPRKASSPRWRPRRRTSRRPPMRADNTAPDHRRGPQRHELTRAKAIQALRELDHAGTPVTFAARRRGRPASPGRGCIPSPTSATRSPGCATPPRGRPSRRSRPASGPARRRCWPGWPEPPTATASSPRKTPACAASSPTPSATGAPARPGTWTRHAASNTSITITPRRPGPGRAPKPRQQHCPPRKTPGHSHELQRGSR